MRFVTDFVIKQILLEENAYRDVSHVILMGEGKEKKSVKQSQDSSADSDIKKNIKCHYCKKKRHLKLECIKLKVNQSVGTVPENRRVEGSKTQTTKVAATSKEEEVVCFFMACVRGHSEASQNTLQYSKGDVLSQSDG